MQLLKSLPSNRADRKTSPQQLLSLRRDWSNLPSTLTVQSNNIDDAFLPVVVARAAALGAADALSLHVSIQIEGRLVIVLVIVRSARRRILVLIVVAIIIPDVFILGFQMLRHHERLVVEFERVVVVGLRVVAVAVRVVRHGAHGALVVVRGLPAVLRVRRQRRGRLGAAAGRRRRSNAQQQTHKRMK